MSALVILIPAALLLGFLALGMFIWSAKNGQYDDLDGAANRILYDDNPSQQGEGHKSDNASSNQSDKN